MSATRLRPRLLLTVLLVCAVLIPFFGGTASAKPKNPPPPPATLTIGVFNRPLPALAAEAYGFFAEQNLTVNYQQVTSSTQQFQYLRDGLYDMIHSATDNWPNYRLNPNNAAGGTLNIQGVMGIDNSQNLALVVRPEITSLEDLRGKRLAVDAPDSGFAYVLYRMLENVGLERDVDYTIVIAGGNAGRYQQLLAGDFDGTLLNAGFETRAANAGFNILQVVTDVVDPYFGAFAGGRVDWMEAHSSEVVRYIAAYYKASQWVFDPANKEAAIQLLMAQPNTTRELAEQLYDLQLNQSVGLIPDLSIDKEGLYNVLKLRDDFGGFELPQNLRRLSTPGGGLYTQKYYRDALKLVRHSN